VNPAYCFYRLKRFEILAFALSADTIIILQHFTEIYQLLQNLKWRNITQVVMMYRADLGNEQNAKNFKIREQLVYDAWPKKFMALHVNT
jgi:hypothetical protein